MLAPSLKIIAADTHKIPANKVSRNAATVVLDLQDAGYEAYLVGGCVRDLLVGLQPKDFDVATSATPEQVKAVFRSARIIGRRFRLVHVRMGREVLEVATFRAQAADLDEQEQQAAAGDHATDESGRILRDNVFGSVEEDAIRRDLSCNALYYDPSDETIRDYVDGVADIEAGRLRMIGDPEQRYREDPVRMLRAVRFACKLDCEIESATAEPIRRLAPLMDDIPAARLFEEVLKLLQSGQGLKTFEMLRKYDLFTALFPGTAAVIEDAHEADIGLMQKALENTDNRLAQRKTVTPAFLFAAMLWPAVRQRAEDLEDDGEQPTQALVQAAGSVLSEQLQRVSIPKRFSIPMREIWLLQPRFHQRRGKRPLRLLGHPRFRAAYDFMLLRVHVGDEPEELAEYWTQFQLDNPIPEQPREEREDGERRDRPRRRRRRPRADQGTS